jgi:type I restriction enzyme S subunit
MTWPLQKLADHCDTITKGTTPTSLGMNFAERGVPFVRVQNLVGGTVVFRGDDLFIDDETHDALKRSKIAPGDVLLSIAGTIGRCAIVPEDMAELNCNQAVAILRLGRSIDRRFLMHWISSRAATDQITQNKVTATISNLSLGQIGELKIPLPPLAEQKRIAAILDQADELRRKRRQALDRLNQLGQAIFIEMFGTFHDDFGDWPTQRLETLVKDAQIGAVRGANEMGNEKPVEYLRMDSIDQDGGLRFENLRRVDASKADISKYDLCVGDLLFNTRNSKELVGKTAVVRTKFDGIYNNNILRIRFSEKLNSDYFDSFLRTRKGKTMLDAVKSGTTNVFAIYQNSFLALNVPVPPIGLQQKYSDRLRELFLLRKKKIDALAETSALFSSLQQSAFRGEL